MGFLDHIERCNAHDLAQFTPWYIEGWRAGWIHQSFAPVLQGRPDLFCLSNDGWRLSERLATPVERTQAVERFLLELRERGMIQGWRNEHYPVTSRLDEAPAMAMERAAIPLFGIRAFGVHMTGYVQRADGLHIWVPTRSRSKATYPGMLDNTVAGGHPVGISLYDNMIKECGEEAGIPPEIARQVRSVGYVSYTCQSGMELKPDIQYCFDLELPPDFQPHAVDGEVERFELWPVQRVFATVRDSFDFKYNCNLVLIDFFLRHGLIDVDSREWIDIAAGLRRRIDVPPGY